MNTITLPANTDPYRVLEVMLELAQTVGLASRHVNQIELEMFVSNIQYLQSSGKGITDTIWNIKATKPERNGVTMLHHLVLMRAVADKGGQPGGFELMSRQIYEDSEGFSFELIGGPDSMAELIWSEHDQSISHTKL